MRQKHKLTKIFKSVFVFLLLICLVASSVPMTFAASPEVKSVKIEDIDLIKNTNGYIDRDYNSDTGEFDLEYYRYSYNYNVSYTVTLSDGTVLNSSGGSIEYLDNFYWMDCYDDQSYENQWDIGTHTVAAEIMGFETSFNVNIVNTPIKEIQISDIDIVQSTNRIKDYDYNSSTDEWDLEYYKYEYCPEFKIIFKDGSVVEDKDGFVYNDEYYSIDYRDDQSYKNQWGLGSHKVFAEILGYETFFNVNIVESPFKSFKILEVEQLEEKSNTNSSNEYKFPKFKYKVTKNDGTSFVDMYMGGNNYNDEYLNVPNNYEEGIRKNWGAGKNNSFVVSYANLEATVNVEIIPSSGYEYIEQSGGLYITNVKDFGENINIPSEINGKKVIGITSFGDATETVKNLTVPDTVKNIGEEALRWCVNLKTLKIGSGVNYLEADMFSRCDSLESINISAGNKNYTSVDGVVYNIAKDTLIVYPLGRGENYKVPASVSDIDVLNSWQYVNIDVTFSDTSNSYKTVDDVTYTADMTKVIRCNKDKSGKYDMPNTVTKIADNAFSSCEKLTDVKVSDNVTEIVYRAFENCSSLTNVSIPNTVTAIGEYAFHNCTSLNEVRLPEELVTIDYMAFSQCKLSKIEIPDNVKTIGSQAFYHNESTEITIGKGVEKIDNYAFYGENIENIVIPDNVKEMGNGVFSYCQNLKNVNIGKGTSAIPASAFSRCESLTNITIPENITEIGAAAFRNCGLLEITIPKNISYISDSAFSECENLNNVIFENDSVRIGNGAFSGCPLKNFKPDSNISSYGLYCFSNTQIESVNISKTVTELTYGSFFGCQNLSSINIPENVLKIGGRSLDGTKWYNSQADGAVYLDHIFYTYKGEMPKNTKINIKNGTKTIADYAFMNSSNLTELTLPNSLKRIGSLSFYNCNSITTINIPSSVEDIGQYAFANCKSLTAINVSADNQNYTSVDGVLFNKEMTELIYCPKQSTDTYVVPTSVKKIKAFAFDSGCVANVTITNKNIELEEYALGANLCTIYLPEKSSEEAKVRYIDISISCPKDSTTEEYANEHLIDVLSYVDPTQDVNIGDANGDGEINAKDRMMLTRHLAKWSGYENIDMTAADLNNDGAVNAKDRMILTRHIAKWSGYETLPYTK